MVKDSANPAEGGFDVSSDESLLPEASPVCGRCFTEALLGDHYCRVCQFPTGDFTLIMPFVRIHGMVQFYSAMWRRFTGRELKGWHERLLFLLGGLLIVS